MYRRATRSLRPRLSVFRTTAQPSTLSEIKDADITKHGVLTQDKNMLNKLNEIEKSITYETPEDMMRITSNTFTMMEKKNRMKVLNALKLQKERGSSDAGRLYNQFIDIDKNIETQKQEFYDKADELSTNNQAIPNANVISANLKKMVKNDDDNIDNTSLHTGTLNLIQQTHDTGYLTELKNLIDSSLGFSPIAILENDISSINTVKLSRTEISFMKQLDRLSLSTDGKNKVSEVARILIHDYKQYLANGEITNPRELLPQWQRLQSRNITASLKTEIQAIIDTL